MLEAKYAQPKNRTWNSATQKGYEYSETSAAQKWTNVTGSRKWNGQAPYTKDFLIAGIVLEKFESKSFLIISGNQFVMAITAGALTLCTSLWSMCIVSGMQGATLGALDAVGTVLCLNIWSGSQYKSDPFVHSLHFSFALGALLSPLIAAQFLSERFADSALQPYNVGSSFNLFLERNRINEIVGLFYNAQDSSNGSHGDEFDPDCDCEWYAGDLGTN
ncbi:hypothetical protein TCAL_17093 [Tigriopus californicus]|uniref:Uncharacterized protein n=1 Tax=Tigriopus californicus TaxID=6832 RepID=A0A553PQY6_TIGCA|nr:hypothetical protein TCAL_17093 [Tigriopus californicus]